jgi:hypothetical protein
MEWRKRSVPIFKAALLRTTQFTREKLGHFRHFERVVALAIDALELSTARFVQQKSHRLATFRAAWG